MYAGYKMGHSWQLLEEEVLWYLHRFTTSSLVVCGAYIYAVCIFFISYYCISFSKGDWSTDPELGTP